MMNFIGKMPDRERVLALPGVHLHDYGKAPRPGRKIGHCTIVAATAAERDRLLRRVLEAAAGLRRAPTAGRRDGNRCESVTDRCFRAPVGLPYSSGPEHCMYLEHFKLKELPFRLSPDPRSCT